MTALAAAAALRAAVIRHAQGLLIAIEIAQMIAAFGALVMLARIAASGC